MSELNLQTGLTSEIALPGQHAVDCDFKHFLAPRAEEEMKLRFISKSFCRDRFVTVAKKGK